jgi:putative ABC transport system permease protein
MTIRIGQLLRLAFADLLHDRIVSFCQVVATAAVLAPLLVLFGLHNGIIGALIERLDRDPAMRLIVPEVTGANRFDDAWFARIGARTDVAFVLPNTRAIAGQVDLLRTDDSGDPPVRVSWLPTAAGDPLAAGGGPLAEGLGEVALTAAAAERLGVATGDAVDAVVERQRDGRIEPVRLRLAVRTIVAATLYDGIAAFVSLPLLQAVQAYRDGHALAALGWAGNGEAPAVTTHPLFRLYARSIRDVARLEKDLRAEGVVVVSRAAEIASALNLERNLVTVLLFIVALAILGFVLAVAANALAAVERKRKSMAVLRLIGYGSAWLIALPVLQAAILALAGVGLAAVGFAGVAAIVNATFADSLRVGEAACRLAPLQLLAAGAATAVVATLPAVLGGLAAARVQPSLELRNV